MYLPESPKFLLSCGRFEEALAIFRGIYVTNTGNDASMYPVKELLIDDRLRAELEDVKKPIKNKYKRMLFDIVDNSKQLFQSPILKFTLISITINLTFHIGYYGLMVRVKNTANFEFIALIAFFVGRCGSPNCSIDLMPTQNLIPMLKTLEFVKLQTTL
jgi:hypothetical protein